MHKMSTLFFRQWNNSRPGSRKKALGSFSGIRNW